LLDNAGVGTIPGTDRTVVFRNVNKPLKKRIILAPTVETDDRRREIDVLIAIAEPDPEYQGPLVTDEASLLDAVGASPREIQDRLDAHFGERLPIPLSTPLWRLVDYLKSLHPGWPDR
jgi:hypothetical protein